MKSLSGFEQGQQKYVQLGQTIECNSRGMVPLFFKGEIIIFNCQVVRGQDESKLPTAWLAGNTG